MLETTAQGSGCIDSCRAYHISVLLRSCETSAAFSQPSYLRVNYCSLTIAAAAAAASGS
jgi:hypothetical protein